MLILSYFSICLKTYIDFMYFLQYAAMTNSNNTFFSKISSLFTLFVIRFHDFVHKWYLHTLNTFWKCMCKTTIIVVMSNSVQIHSHNPTNCKIYSWNQYFTYCLFSKGQNVTPANFAYSKSAWKHQKLELVPVTAVKCFLFWPDISYIEYNNVILQFSVSFAS